MNLLISSSFLNIFLGIINFFLYPNDLVENINIYSLSKFTFINLSISSNAISPKLYAHIASSKSIYSVKSDKLSSNSYCNNDVVTLVLK